MAWGTDSYSGLAETYFVYLALRTSVLGMGQAVRLGKRNTLCCKSRMEMYFYLVLWFFLFCFLLYFVLNFFRIAKWCWHRWVSAGSLGSLLPWPGRRIPQSLECWCSCNIWGKMRNGGGDDGSLRVCGVWVGERDVESHEGWDCFKIWERNKQTQTKWSLKILLLYCFKVYLCMNKTHVKTHEKRQGRENKIFKKFCQIIK